MRKSVLVVSDQVRHKAACAAKEGGYKLEILEKVEEELHCQCSKYKGADQLCSYCTADLWLCFCVGKNPVLS